MATAKSSLSEIIEVASRKRSESVKVRLHYLPECAYFDYIRENLTNKELYEIERILTAYNSGKIDLEIIFDRDGQIDFEKSFDFKMKDPSYKVSGFESDVIKWYINLVSTGYMVDTFKIERAKQAVVLPIMKQYQR